MMCLQWSQSWKTGQRFSVDLLERSGWNLQMNSTLGQSTSWWGSGSAHNRRKPTRSWVTSRRRTPPLLRWNCKTISDEICQDFGTFTATLSICWADYWEKAHFVYHESFFDSGRSFRSCRPFFQKLSPLGNSATWAVRICASLVRS